MSSDYNPDTGKFPEDSPKPDNVLKGPFMQIPGYEDLKKFAADTEQAMAKAREAIARKMAAEFDSQLTTAIDNALGKGQWTMESLQGRIEVHTYGEDDEHGIETIVLDGEPIFRYGLPSIKMEDGGKGKGLVCNATRLMQILNGKGGEG